MKVTINFDASAYNNALINNSTSIKSSVTVEITPEQIAAMTQEQRKLLMQYTEPRNGSRFDEDFYLCNPLFYQRPALLYPSYTENVLEVINYFDAKITKNKENVHEEVASKNLALELSSYEVWISYCGRNTSDSGKRNFMPFERASFWEIVYDKDVTREQMLDNLRNWNTDRNIVVPREVIIDQLLALANQAYDKHEAEQKEAQERREQALKKEEENALRAEQRRNESMNWIKTKGSEYLRQLVENGFNYEEAFKKEYIKYVYGDAHLASDSCLCDMDYTDCTTEVDEPTPEHLEAFLGYKRLHSDVVELILKYQNHVESYDEEGYECSDYDEDSIVYVRVDDDLIDEYIYVQL